MINTFSDLFRILANTIGILLLLIFLYRRYIFSILDPLVFFIITQAFSLELAFLTLKEPFYIFNIIFCELAFYIGFVITASTYKKFKNSGENVVFSLTTYQLQLLQLFCNVSLVIIIIANIYLFSQKGIALFAEDPSEAKVTSFNEGGGLGIVRRIDWGLIFLVGLIYMYLFLQYEKNTYVIALVFIIIIISSGGSKGSLLFYIQAFSVFGIFKSFKKKEKFKTLRRGLFLLIPFSLLLVFFILFAVAQNIDETFFALGSRFLFFGDAMLFFYDKYSIKYFSSFGFFDFLYNEFNPILGFFRFSPYEIPLGYKLVMFKANSSTVPVFGPNVPFYVKGYIYFGKIGVYIYSLLLGLFIGKIRKTLFEIAEKNTNSIMFLFIILINLLVFGIVQDSALFISVLFDTIIFSLPALLISYTLLLTKYKFLSTNIPYS